MPDREEPDAIVVEVSPMLYHLRQALRLSETGGLVAYLIEATILEVERMEQGRPTGIDRI